MFLLVCALCLCRRCNPRDFLEDVLYNAHVAKSMYAMQLRRWFDVFGRDSFKVLLLCVKHATVLIYYDNLLLLLFLLVRLR